MHRPDFYVSTKSDLKEAVQRLGFLPYFTNSIPGFSIEEHVDPKAWFGSEPGTWEWKGPVIRETGCAYGKFFENKAAYVSPEWFPDLANYRRDGYDFDSRFDDELASYRDKELYDLVAAGSPVLSKELREKGNYVKGGKKGFETLINRLQAQCYVIISDFVYSVDKNGREYGWGIAEYSTPEKFMGERFTSSVYARTPRESYERIFAHIKSILPDADDKAIKKFLA